MNFLILPTLDVNFASRVFVLVWLYILLRFLRKNIYLSALFWWAGTVGHELCHFVVGFLLWAKPRRIDLIPRKDATTGGLVLGSVTFENLVWWNKLPVATAPLLLLPIGYWIFIQSLHTELMSLDTLLFDLAVLQCLEGCWPSGTDWRHAMKTVYALICIALALGAGYYFFFN